MRVIMKTKASILIVASVLFVWSASLRAENLVANGGFEDGYSSGWNHLAGDGGAATYSAETENVAEGAIALRVDVTAMGANNWSVQSLGPILPLVQGEEYELTFSARAEVAGTEVRIVVQDDVYTQRTFSLTTDWAQYTWSFTAQEDNPRLRIHYRETGTLWLDDFVIPAAEAGEGIPIALLPEIRHQEMAGFGAALSWYLSSVYRNNETRDAAINQAMFEDLGLDILRLKNWYYPDDADSASAMNSHSINAQLYHAATSANPDIKILYSSWSPPDALKSTGRRRGSDGEDPPTIDSGTLAKDGGGNFMYEALADYWVEVLDNLGWTPDYLSFQNEPGYQDAWETCLFAPTQTSSLSGYAEAADAIWNAIKDRPDVPKMVGSEAENMPSFFDFNQQLLSRPYFAVHGYHVYDIGNPGQIDSSTTIGRLNRIRDDFGDRPNWQTEFSREFNWIDAGRVIHNTLVEANASAYIYWKMFWGSDTPEAMIEHVDNTSFQINPPYYTIKHYARHIHKGYERIEVGGSGTDVRVSGFLSPTGDSITLVAINSSGSQEEISLEYGALRVEAIEGYQSVAGNFYQAMSGLDLEDPIVLPSSSITTIVLTLETYTVSYDGNENTDGSVPPSQTKGHGLPLTLASNSGDLVREGFVFGGWNTEADGSGDTYAEGATYTHDADVTLYARWVLPLEVDAGPDQTVYLTDGGDEPWTPEGVALAAWYDASDSDSITLSGGRVAQWDDKSGNDRHAVQTASNRQPGYRSSDTRMHDLPSIGYDSVATDVWRYLEIPALTFSNVYVVTYYDAAQFDNWRVLISDNQSTVNRIRGSQNNTTWNLAGFRMYRDGASDTTTTALPMGPTLWRAEATRDFGHVPWTILGQMDGWWSTWGDGAIGEMIVTDGTEALETQQMIEGYLAHKWGLNLEDGHPYKATAPGVASATATLAGTVSHPEHDPVTTTWTLEAGPASVSFADASAPHTTVTFAEVGSYTLRLTAGDGVTQAYDEVQIIVTDAVRPIGTILHFR